MYVCAPTHSRARWVRHFANIFSRALGPMMPMDFHTNGSLFCPPRIGGFREGGHCRCSGSKSGWIAWDTHTHCNVLGIYCCGFVGAIYWQYLSPAWPGAFSTISTGTVPLKDYQHSSSPFSPGKRPLLKSMCGFISSVHNNFILILICPDILGSTDGCFPPRNEFIWVLRPAAKAASNKQIRTLERTRLRLRERRSLRVLLMCAWICWCKYLKFPWGYKSMESLLQTLACRVYFCKNGIINIFVRIKLYHAWNGTCRVKKKKKVCNICILQCI